MYFSKAQLTQAGGSHLDMYPYVRLPHSKRMVDPQQESHNQTSLFPITTDYLHHPCSSSASVGATGSAILLGVGQLVV